MSRMHTIIYIQDLPTKSNNFSEKLMLLARTLQTDIPNIYIDQYTGLDLCNWSPNKDDDPQGQKIQAMKNCLLQVFVDAPESERITIL